MDRVALKESREGFFRRERRKVERSKTERAREPTVVSGTRDLESESIGGRVESTGVCVCKIGDSHGDKTKQCT